MKATLNVPGEYVSGAEIENGGIFVEWGDCDYPLNAFLSYETANHIIETAPIQTLTDKSLGFRLVEAELFIWKFSDSSGEPRFFVMSVDEMTPINAPRTPRETQGFGMPAH